MKMHKTFYVTKSKKKKKPSQKALFLEIWEEREHSCVDCGKYLREPKAHNFDHILTKGSRVDLKYDKTNIDIVCFACHFYRTNKMIYKGPELDI